MTPTHDGLAGVLLITGGTGSFGHAVLRRVLDSAVSEIRIFSRDEKKQDDMRKRYASSKLRFYLGDVRDQIVDYLRGCLTTDSRECECRLVVE